MTSRYSTAVQSENGADMFILCICFTERNGYPTTCLDLAQYVVDVMPAGAQSNKLPAFYTKTALTF